MSEENRVVTVRVPEHVHKRARVKIAEEGTSFQDVLLGQLQGFISNTETNAGTVPGAIPSKNPLYATSKSPGKSDNQVTKSLPEKDERWIEMLTGILVSGHEVAIEAVTRNLVAFDLLVRLDLGDKGAAKTDGPPASPHDSTEFRRIKPIPEVPRDSDRKRSGTKKPSRKTG